MSELTPYQPSAVALPPTAPIAADEGVRQVALLVYGLYLASLVMPPLLIAGAGLAYANRETAPDWLRSHFGFQVRTFWLYLAYLAVSILMCAVLIGFPMIVAAMGWFVTRQVMGLGYVLKREAHPKPFAWV
jgi:uncharacterized membrane protein